MPRVRPMPRPTPVHSSLPRTTRRHRSCRSAAPCSPCPKCSRCSSPATRPWRRRPRCSSASSAARRTGRRSRASTASAHHLLPSIVSSDTPPTTDAALQTWIAATRGLGLRFRLDVARARRQHDLRRVLACRCHAHVRCSTSCIDFGGYHSDEGVLGRWHDQVRLRAAAALRQRHDRDRTTLTSATSHEFIEASTDPYYSTAPAVPAGRRRRT